MNKLNKSPQISEKLALVCMDSYDSESRRIFSALIFSRSTRFVFLCTAQTSKFQQNTRDSVGDFE